MNVTVIAMGLSTGACAGNPYGYARTYQPLGDEKAYVESTSQRTYEDVRRDPEAARQEMLGWFGVVTGVLGKTADGETAVALTLRYHQPRHLCRDQAASSCRVTVSEASSGPLTVLVRLRDVDVRGRDRVWTGSLLKVYGRPTGQLDDMGGPVIRAEHYRHWPANTYVTTAARNVMRR